MKFIFFQKKIRIQLDQNTDILIQNLGVDPVSIIMEAPKTEPGCEGKSSGCCSKKEKACNHNSNVPRES